MKTIVIVGGGAAGIFAAALLAQKTQGMRVIVLEKTRQLLAKVRISGGGRCNVTHSEFDPKKLVQNYPRGAKQLLGPFHHFQPQDMIHWLEGQGVRLKREEDGRMFPITDSSATIIDCLLKAAKPAEIRCEHTIRSIEKKEKGFVVHVENRESIPCDALLLATGSHPMGHALASLLGHTIVPSIPSLFTFNVPSSPYLDLAGITLPNVELRLEASSYQSRGSLLLTHWGFSGPAALKLSAFAAKELHQCNYQAKLYINWVGKTKPEVLSALKQSKNNPFKLPSKLWKRLHFPQVSSQELAEQLTASCFLVDGKTTYKSEFVTCGGVDLKQVDFRTCQSKLVPGLFFAGEILDIDGITGGFNFQNAWTTAFLAAKGISSGCYGE